MKLPNLILASGSPRRAEILRSVGWDFSKIVADIDETERPGEFAAEYVQRLALEKAQKVSESIESGLILGADTTVVVDDQIIGKPVDTEDARRMIRMLAGKCHEVLTGVAFVKKESSDAGPLVREIVGLQTTLVKFGEMNETEIDFLAREGSPLDKAGAYAVQAQAALFIEEIEGDYWNIVGLPVNLVYRLFREINC